MAFTKGDTVNALVEQLKDAEKAVDRSLKVAGVVELIKKLDDFGDVRAQIITAEKILPLLRSLRTTRIPATLNSVMKRRDSLRRAKELLHTLGTLSLLKDQIAILEEVRAELLQPRDIDTLIRKLEGLGEKLDALGELVECLKAWEPWD